jgi:hypothetical protein
MRLRVQGLPVAGGLLAKELDSSEFSRRIVGTIVHAYPADGALMGIARICNDSALRVVQSGAFDTRLVATFDDDAAEIDVNEGRMLIEPPARYLSHCR